MSNPIYFPQLASGAQTQRPYRTNNDFNTIFQDNPYGRPYAYSKRAGGGPLFSTVPLGNFSVNFVSISDAEVATLSSFFDSMRGRLNEFVYLDPVGNLINNSEDFTQTSWTSQLTSVMLSATGVTDPYGGTRASTLTATSLNSNMTPIVVPGGFLPANYVLCVSTWARALTANQTLEIGFVDSGFSVLGNAVWNLPQNVWTRIYFALRINTTSYIRALFGGGGTWNSTAIQFFGPQCVPMMGPGGYVKSPDNFGYNPQCRFDTDQFTFLAKAPNDNQVSLPVVEYYLS